MNSNDFTFWLNGFFELNDAGGAEWKGLTPEQVTVLRDHLKLVFHKVTPDRNMKNLESAIASMPKPSPHNPSYCAQNTKVCSSSFYNPDAEGYRKVEVSYTNDPPVSC